MSSEASVATAARSEEIQQARERYVARGVATTPLVVARAEGARVWDVDGREFIDLMCTFGPILHSDEGQMCNAHSQHCHAEQQHVEHSAGRHKQTADHRRYEKRDPQRGAHQTVGLVPAVLRNQDRHQRLQRDRPDIARDHPEHRQDNEDPQQDAGWIGEGLLGRQLIQRERHGVEDRRDHRRDLHYGLLPVMVDQAAKPDPADGRGHQEDASDHSSCEHRLGFQENPERDGEPHREVDD